MTSYSTIELCAGGGGQAIGLEMADFKHLACVEYELEFCKTLMYNRPEWNVVCQDIRDFDGTKYKQCDLLAGGVPCPPFSIAGKQLGENDERDMFPPTLRLIKQIKPRGIMLENVKGLMAKKFDTYRARIVQELTEHGYEVVYKVLEASDFGVPQLRPRFVLVALSQNDMRHFMWPKPLAERKMVGETIGKMLEANGWSGAISVCSKADNIAPTIVGGSKKHGGPDLGPTRAREQWKKLGIDGSGIANLPPDANFPLDAMPKLTIKMAAAIQGFPDDWQFCGSKTTQYRQIGNAFPPPVARAIGESIKNAFRRSDYGKV